MATADEVTVSMGEVVMVKADGEGDPDDPNKTQVILQLQPITTGYVHIKLTTVVRTPVGTEVTMSYNNVRYLSTIRFKSRLIITKSTRVRFLLP